MGPIVEILFYARVIYERVSHSKTGYFTIRHSYRILLLGDSRISPRIANSDIKRSGSPHRFSPKKSIDKGIYQKSKEAVRLLICRRTGFWFLVLGLSVSHAGIHLAIQEILANLNGVQVGKFESGYVCGLF